VEAVRAARDAAFERFLAGSAAGDDAAPAIEG
jgi:hypothetical protein